MNAGNFLSYGTIVKAVSGEPGAMETVLKHYSGYIRHFSKMNGYVNVDIEDHVKERLIEGILKFRFVQE